MVPNYIPPMIPSWQVVSGPGREALFDSLRLLPEERTVNFEFILPSDDREEMELKILAIEATNNNDEGTPNGGKTWIVKGIDVHPDTQGDRICLLYYNTQSRTGTIQFCATGIVGPSFLPADERFREGFFVFLQLIQDDGYEGDYMTGWLWVGPFGSNEERKEFLNNFLKLPEVCDAPTGTRVHATVCNAIQETIIPLSPKDFSLDRFRAFPQSEDDSWGQDPENPEE